MLHRPLLREFYMNKCTILTIFPRWREITFYIWIKRKCLLVLNERGENDIQKCFLSEGVVAMNYGHNWNYGQQQIFSMTACQDRFLQRQTTLSNVPFTKQKLLPYNLDGHIFIVLRPQEKAFEIIQITLRAFCSINQMQMFFELRIFIFLFLWLLQK